MHFFQKKNNSTQLLWMAFLSIALMCSQGMKFHLHGLDHGDDDLHRAHQSVAVEHEHMTLSNLHSLNDLSHVDHHHEIVFEIDASKNVLLKNIAGKVPALALLVSIFPLLLTVFIRDISFRSPRSDVEAYWSHHLSPPLRAPPP